MNVYRGSNAAGRRKYRRRLSNIWGNTVIAFIEGTTVRIKTNVYGQRYDGTKATVVSKGKGYGTVVLSSPRRKTPLIVQIDHIENVA